MKEEKQTITKPSVKEWNVECGFCRNTIVFSGLKKGTRIGCPKCNQTLEVK